MKCSYKPEFEDQRSPDHWISTLNNEQVGLWCHFSPERVFPRQWPHGQEVCPWGYPDALLA